MTGKCDKQKRLDLVFYLRATRTRFEIGRNWGWAGLRRRDCLSMQLTDLDQIRTKL